MPRMEADSIQDLRDNLGFVQAFGRRVQQFAYEINKDFACL